MSVCASSAVWRPEHLPELMRRTIHSYFWGLSCVASQVSIRVFPAHHCRHHGVRDERGGGF